MSAFIANFTVILSLSFKAASRDSMNGYDKTQSITSSSILIGQPVARCDVTEASTERNGTLACSLVPSPPKGGLAHLLDIVIN